MTFPLFFLQMAREGLREEAVYDEGKWTSCRGEEMLCSLSRLCFPPHSSVLKGPLLTRPSKLSATAPCPPPPPRPLAQSRVRRPFSIQRMVPPARMWTSLGTIVLSHPVTTAYVLSQDRTCFWTKPGMGSGPAPHDLELNIVSDFKIKLSAMRFRLLGRGWPAPFQKLLESSWLPRAQHGHAFNPSVQNPCFLPCVPLTLGSYSQFLPRSAWFPAPALLGDIFLSHPGS